MVSAAAAMSSTACGFGPRGPCVEVRDAVVSHDGSGVDGNWAVVSGGPVVAGVEACAVLRLVAGGDGRVMVGAAALPVPEAGFPEVRSS